MPFSPTFVLLQKEAFLAQGSLSVGLTALRNAVFPDMATFYSGFFNTSIAFERVMKLIVVIDHMLQHNHTPPNIPELKRYGHNLKSLYASCTAAANHIGLAFTLPVANSLEERILLFLSEFATVSRYYNLDALLATPGSHAEPLGAWESIMDAVLIQDVPAKKVQAQLARAQLVQSLFAENMTAIQHGMNGQLLSLPQVFSTPAKHELAAPYAMVRVFNLLRPLLRTADEFGRLAFYGPPKPPSPLAPLLHEFFCRFSGRDEEIRRKKRWP